MAQIDYATVCADLTEKACSQALASSLKPVFIIAGFVVLVFIVVRHVYFLNATKKSLTKSHYWVGLVLFDIFILVFLTLLYFMTPWLIRVFNIIG